MHIKGNVTIFIIHVAGDWVIFREFALLGSMAHRHKCGSLKCMIYTLFANQYISNNSVNLLRYKQGLFHAN